MSRLTINEATIILVAEVLKLERGADEPPLKDAVALIKEAARYMATFGGNNHES